MGVSGHLLFVSSRLTATQPLPSSDFRSLPQVHKNEQKTIIHSLSRLSLLIPYQNINVNLSRCSVLVYFLALFHVSDVRGVGDVIPKPEPLRTSRCCIQMTTHELGNTIVTLISTMFFFIVFIYSSC